MATNVPPREGGRRQTGGGASSLGNETESRILIIGRVLFFLPFPGVVVNNSNLSFSLLLRHRILRGIFPDHSLAHLLAHSLSPLPSCTFPFMAFLILSPTRSDVSSARRTPLQPATTVLSSSRGVENSIHLIFRRPTQCAKSYNISAPGSTRTYIFS